MRNAYVLYATNDSYALAALVAVSRIKHRSAQCDADFVLLYSHVNASIVTVAKRIGIRCLEASPTKDCHSRYYRHCLIKLQCLSLTEYYRVLYLDADSLVLGSMKELFAEELTAAIAAPYCWWGWPGQITTMLLLAEPSTKLASRVAERISCSQGEPVYDMDIVNQEFVLEAKEMHYLSPFYAGLNGIWEFATETSCFGDKSIICERFPLIHFSSVAKPWELSVPKVKKRRPFAHPFFYSLYEQWQVELDTLLDTYEILKDCRCTATSHLPPLKRLVQSIVSFSSR